MAEPVKYDFTIYQGATFIKVITWQDGSGDPIPLGGYRARMQVRTKAGGRVLLELTTENGGIALEPDGATGEIRLKATPAQTGAMAVGGVYDLELEDVNDPTIVERLIEGNVEISKQITV